MIVIGIVGLKGAGKEVVAEYIAKKYGGIKHAHSEIYHQILAVLKIPDQRMNLIKLFELRKVFGENVLVNALNKRIREDNVKLEVITGIRFPNELENIKKYEHNFVLYISAPMDIRFERQRKRGQYAGDDIMSYTEFTRIDTEEPTEVLIRSLGEKADKEIVNEGSLEELYAKVDSIIEPIIQKHGD